MNYRLLIKIVIILVSFSGVTRVFFNNQSIATVLSFILNLISMFLLITMISKKDIYFKKNKLLLIFTLYSCIILIYSLFISDTYFQYRYVLTVYFPGLVLPCIAMLSLRPLISLTILKSFLTISIPLSIFLYFSNLTGMGDFTHYVSFIYVLILFIPFVKKEWKFVIIGVSIVSFFYDLDSRSNLLNICFAYLLMFAHYLDKKRSIIIFRGFRRILIYLPFLLILLGIIGSFNIFKYADFYKEIFVISTGKNADITLTNDSRTNVYKDAFSSILNERVILFGHSAGGYHDTHLKDVESEGYSEYYNFGRLGSEVGILEYLLRGGLVFVFLITLIYYYSSENLLYRSNNSISKLFGVYLAFRFFFMFIEGQPALNLSNISSFVLIGLSQSIFFRNLNDLEIRFILKKAIG